MSDDERQPNDRSSPARYAKVITPADADLTFQVRALYIGGAGDLTVITSGGDEVTFTAVPVGFLLPIEVTQVKAASTVTLVIGLY